MQIMCLYITGHLTTTFTAEHREEVLRYIYNHQVRTLYSYMIFKMNYLIKGLLIDFLSYRTKMVGGDYTLRVTVICIAQLSTTFVCVFLENKLMAMLVRGRKSGFSTMVV
jgi:hypothetical protein